MRWSQVQNTCTIGSSQPIFDNKILAEYLQYSLRRTCFSDIINQVGCLGI
jgi:hypothetical protein